MKFKVNFAFLPIMILYYYLGEIKSLMIFFLSLLLHDTSHYLVAKMFNVNVEELELLPFGCRMVINDYYIDNTKSFFIYLAGPLSNIMFAVFLFLLKINNWLTISLYNDIVFINILIGLVNLMPVFPLDGSIILRNILSRFIGFIRSTKLIIIISQIVSIFLIVITLYSLINNIYNINFGIVGIFLLIQSIKEKKNLIFNSLHYEVSKRSRLDKNQVLPSKRICANIKTPVINILNKFVPNRYYLIDIIDENYKYILTLTEEDIINGISRNGYNCILEDILIK